MAIVHRTRGEEIALGMTLLGLVASSIFYGITLTQVYKYFKRFPKDHNFVKFLVIAVCVLDTISTGFVTHACWYYLVTTGSIRRSIWSLNAELVVSMVISGIAESEWRSICCSISTSEAVRKLLKREGAKYHTIR
ncbi:hypothetical protein HGRIS_000329 [Hohenbuehelia grisea]|uniref:Uncharacterized protein n=1 Tax=Hohenbuehelia grisea TaxID=104357 RepID=A0ABR3JSL2_9AGAR